MAASVHLLLSFILSGIPFSSNILLFRLTRKRQKALADDEEEFQKLMSLEHEGDGLEH